MDISEEEIFVSRLHEALEWVKKQAPFKEGYGLCDVVTFKIGQLYGINHLNPYTDLNLTMFVKHRLRDWSRTWKDFSGDPDFPVPHEYLPPDSAFISCSHWTKPGEIPTEYELKRLALLDHWIKCAEESKKD